MSNENNRRKFPLGSCTTPAFQQVYINKVLLRYNSESRKNNDEK